MFLQKISVFNGKKINHDFFGPESKKKIIIFWLKLFVL